MVYLGKSDLIFPTIGNSSKSADLVIEF